MGPDRLPPEANVLITLLTELREREILEEVQRLLSERVDPLLIVEWCQEGMRNVGAIFEDGRYFISGLIMAGEILRQILELIFPVMQERTRASDSGRILIGTVQGDIHDIGKNLFSMVLTCNGFQVQDLGVDVSPADFLAQALEFRPRIIAISSLLTMTYDAMRETVNLLKSNREIKSMGIKTIVGGGFIDEKVCRYVRADHWARDAIGGIRFCQKITSVI